MTSLSVAVIIFDQTSPEPCGRRTVTSPNAPCTRLPMGFGQQRDRTSPALLVTMATRSLSLRSNPCFLATIFAIFTSPRTCLVPEGPQSEPRQTDTPRALAAATFVVDPYSHRFENGDHTTPPAAAFGQRFQSASE